MIRAIPSALNRKATNLFRREQQYLKRQGSRNIFSGRNQDKTLSKDEDQDNRNQASIDILAGRNAEKRSRVDIAAKLANSENDISSSRRRINSGPVKTGKLMLMPSDKTLHSPLNSALQEHQNSNNPYNSHHLRSDGPQHSNTFKYQSGGNGNNGGNGNSNSGGDELSPPNGDIIMVPGSMCQSHDIMDGILSDPSDCSRYFVCAFGQEFSKSCPLGLLWNQRTKSCDWPENVSCANKNHMLENMVDLRCGRDKISCASGNQCIFLDQLCDKKTDCIDMSDEITCDPYKVGVLPGKVISVDGGTIIPFCGSGHALCTSRTQCVIISQLCDGIENCPDGSDEADEMCLKSPR
ncbi:unnamed protein product [Gordionus sp. m RMFG-2023]